MEGYRKKGMSGPRFEHLTGVLVRVQEEELGIAHRSRGRLEGLCLAACVTAVRTDWSMLWAAKMEEIDSSKEAGSSTSAGTRLFKSSTVRVGFEVGIEDEVET